MPFAFNRPCSISLFRHRNTRYFMTYIVDLTVILHRLFLSTRRVSAMEVQTAVKDYAESSSREQIHEDIRSYVTSAQTYLSSYHDKDLAMEKIIDLIEQYCCTYTKQQLP